MSDRERARRTAGDYTHGLFLGKRWYDRAEENIDQWGNQSPGLLFLALVEELGEIAEELVEQSEGRPPRDDEKGPWSEAWRFINDTRRLGLDARDFLEANFDDPAGETDTSLPADMDILAPFEDEESIQDEVDDAAPLLFQLSWALEAARQDTETAQDGGSS